MAPKARIMPQCCPKKTVENSTGRAHECGYVQFQKNEYPWKVYRVKHTQGNKAFFNRVIDELEKKEQHQAIIEQAKEKPEQDGNTNSLCLITGEYGSQ